METLRIGLVGTGGIGRTHIERINNTLQGGKVVAAPTRRAHSAFRLPRSTASRASKTPST